MKKNLIVALALVFVLGIAGTAFAAANPFVDVPAKHWAYDAVSKLAQAGILDGYGDGTYRGERLATRYEMAQATAKAMARSDKANAQLKALIDKLAVEFAAELNNLGVRVAKLEKNASSIKFWGDARMQYMSNVNHVINDVARDGQSRFRERIRVYATAEVNEKTQFNARLSQEWVASSVSTGATTGIDNHGFLRWEIANFAFKTSPTTMWTIGRMAPSVGNGLLYGTTGYVDGIAFDFGTDVKAQIGYADIGQLTQNASTSAANLLAVGGGQNNGAPAMVGWIDLKVKASKDVTLFGGLWNSFSSDNVTFTAGNGNYANGYPFQIWTLGFTAKMSDWTLDAQYAQNAAPRVGDAAVSANYTGDPRTFWGAALAYKGADRTKPQSWGAKVTYRDLKPMSIDTYIAAGPIIGNDNAINAASVLYNGYKGFTLEFSYAAAKNLVLTATYGSMTRNRFNDTQALAPYYYLQANYNF